MDEAPSLDARVSNWALACERLRRTVIFAQRADGVLLVDSEHGDDTCVLLNVSKAVRSAPVDRGCAETHGPWDPFNPPTALDIIVRWSLPHSREVDLSEIGSDRRQRPDRRQR